MFFLFVVFAKRMNDIEFANQMQRYLWKPFSLGDPSRGWDCLNQLIDFAKRNNLEFPKEFKGWNEQNYAERWDRGEGMQVFKEFLLILGESVDRGRMLPGDIVILEMPDAAGNKIISAVQYVGDGKIKAVPKEMGTIVLPLAFFGIAIKGIRRLRKKSLPLQGEGEDGDGTL